jgi:hypothetical protein
MTDPTTTIIAWSLASLVAGYLGGRWDARRIGTAKSKAARLYEWARGTRIGKDGAPMARERPRRLPDDDKSLLAIVNQAQIAAEVAEHKRRDRLTLDFWTHGTHVEFCPTLQTVARFVSMPAPSRRKYWEGGAEVYSRMLAACVHRGLVLRISETPARFAWSRRWKTCRRRVTWFADMGYPLPPPRDWSGDPATDD